MKSKMTVKELMEMLSKFDENAIVEVDGGEGAYGEFGRLWVDDEVVMEY